MYGLQRRCKNMEAAMLKDEISKLFKSTVSAQVYFVLKSNETFTLKLADIESDTAGPEIDKLFCDYISSFILENDDLQVCELSTADERSNAVYHYDYTEYPEELGIFKDFNIKRAVKDIPKFNAGYDDLGSLYGYIIYLGSMDKGIYLFKKHYPLFLIKRDTLLLGAIKSKKRFEKIESDDTLRLNGTIQFLRLNEEIYVLDVKVLERNMGFTQLIHKTAGETIQAIKELKLLEDIQVLQDSVENLSFARKLSKVKKSSPIFELRISKETIIEFTKTTPALSGKFKYSEDGSTIRLDTKKSKDAFIMLMNDAFLHSELSKRYYEAKAKDSIS